jgi:hypothetical protein
VFDTLKAMQATDDANADGLREWIANLATKNLKRQKRGKEPLTEEGFRPATYDDAPIKVPDFNEVNPAGDTIEDVIRVEEWLYMDNVEPIARELRNEVANESGRLAEWNELLGHTDEWKTFLDQSELLNSYDLEGLIKQDKLYEIMHESSPDYNALELILGSDFTLEALQNHLNTNEPVIPETVIPVAEPAEDPTLGHVEESELDLTTNDT